MPFGKSAIADLKFHFGDRLSTAGPVREHHGKGFSYHPGAPPDAVVFAKAADEVQRVVASCARHRVPLIPFGTGTSVEGQIAALQGGICLDLSGMNAILAVHAADMDAVAGPGVTRKEPTMRKTTKLRQTLRTGKTIWASGAYDARSAALIEEAEFDAILTSGFAISASHLGEPDVEIYTMTENFAVVRHAVNRTGIPVIADCDTGYGNATNVMRTVREFEQAGDRDRGRSPAARREHGEDSRGGGGAARSGSRDRRPHRCGG